VWALLAALGLFIAGGAVSVTHGVQEFFHPQPAEHFVIGYIVLAVSFLLEGTSFLPSVRQARGEAATFQRDVIEHVLRDARGGRRRAEPVRPRRAGPRARGRLTRTR
jgi:hypothetical protein